MGFVSKPSTPREEVQARDFRSRGVKEYVQERVAEGIYSNPSDYVRALIRTDMKRRGREELAALLLEGLKRHLTER